MSTVWIDFVASTFPTNCAYNCAKCVIFAQPSGTATPYCVGESIKAAFSDTVDAAYLLIKRYQASPIAMGRMETFSSSLYNGTKRDAHHKAESPPPPDKNLLIKAHTVSNTSKSWPSRTLI